jgi:hypothetical protein
LGGVRTGTNGVWDFSGIFLKLKGILWGGGGGTADGHGWIRITEGRERIEQKDAKNAKGGLERTPAKNQLTGGD